MLLNIDKDKIIVLRTQSFSYHAIHEKLGFAVDTSKNFFLSKREKKKNKNIEGGEKK